MDEYDDDEEDGCLLYVTVEVTYTMEEWPGIEHNAVHRFVDYAPDFPNAHQVYKAYSNHENVYYRILHAPMPKDPTPVPTHDGPVILQ